MKIRSLENYGIVDCNVMADPSITPQAKALYGLLCCYGHISHPGIHRLQTQMGVSESSIQRWLRELVEAKVIRREDYHKGKNTKTEILDSKKNLWRKK